MFAASQVAIGLCTIGAFFKKNWQGVVFERCNSLSNGYDETRMIAQHDSRHD